MATLKEIAADLGVSHALVSRVLNNRMGTTGVSAKTREAIHRRARELGYKPNRLALALREGRRGAVGLYVHDVGVRGSDLVGPLVEAVGDGLDKLGTNLILHCFRGQADFEATCTTELLNKVDGLIIAGIGFPWMLDRVRKLERAGLPIVAACHGRDFNEFVNFQVNEELQGYISAKHLVEIGCRKIVHLYALESRYKGYVRALKEAGIPLDERLVIRMPGPDYFIARRGFEAARQLLDSNIEFDAIHTQSDAQAAGFLQHFALRGIKRKNWPKITGIDNSPIAEEYALVPLTSVTAETDTAGRMAVEALNKRLHGEKVESKQIEPRLVIRESTAG